MPYEGSTLANQNDRKLGICPEVEGNPLPIAILIDRLLLERNDVNFFMHRSNWVSETLSTTLNLKPKKLRIH